MQARPPRRLPALLWFCLLGGTAATAAAELAACRGNTSPSAGPAFNYDLRCDSSDTATESRLFCVRLDTRSGDVLRINHQRLPTSNGPTASAPGPAGTFAIECDATATDTRSDFYCLRLDRNTGDLLLINLPKVGELPAATPAAAPQR